MPDHNQHLAGAPGQELPVPKGAARYVRITERMANGCIAFDFAVGSPDLFVELVLPEDAFEAFCRTNRAVHMTPEESAIVDREMRKWRYGEEGLALRASSRELRNERP